jgi:hypothetical protein
MYDNGSEAYINNLINKFKTLDIKKAFTEIVKDTEHKTLHSPKAKGGSALI